jgi:hypothetical protein
LTAARLKGLNNTRRSGLDPWANSNGVVKLPSSK